jgi:hypothetical protein
MGTIVVTTFSSLDGVVQAPGGEDFKYANWSFEFDRGPDGEKFKEDEAFWAAAPAHRVVITSAPGDPRDRGVLLVDPGVQGSPGSVTGASARLPGGGFSLALVGSPTKSQRDNGQHQGMTHEMVRAGLTRH